ncbi:MAG: HisA/HisF-related TIM barrel protein [Methylophilaceae bacterium]
MHIIPVIDLLNGTIVHAKKGERSCYAPMTSCLTKSSQPLDIVKAFMDIYPFKTLYIADLNAIQALENTGANHINIIAEINAVFPDVELWVDAGITTIRNAKKWAALQVNPVLGSESFSTLAQYQSLASSFNNAFTLSLDFPPQGYKGPSVLIQSSQYWPSNIIVMSLAKVGTNSGIDTETIKSIMAKTNHHAIYAAGGIRHSEDVDQLKQLGVKGCLLASALHNKQISTKDLSNLVS